MTPGQLVRTLYERYQARNWSDAALLLHEDSMVLMPATNEQLIGRDQVIGMQRDYPEPWGDLQVLRVIGDERGAVAELEVVAQAAVFRCAVFWDVDEGLLHRGVEYWVTVGGEEPPPDRRRTTANEARMQPANVYVRFMRTTPVATGAERKQRT